MKDAIKLFDKILNHLNDNDNLLISWNKTILESVVFDDIIKYYVHLGDTLNVLNEDNISLLSLQEDSKHFTPKIRLTEILKECYFDYLIIDHNSYLVNINFISKLKLKKVIVFDNYLRKDLSDNKIFLENRSNLDESKNKIFYIDDDLVEYLNKNINFMKCYIRTKKIKNIL